jgi:hypothetical protein
VELLLKGPIIGSAAGTAVGADQGPLDKQFVVINLNAARTLFSSNFATCQQQVFFLRQHEKSDFGISRLHTIATSVAEPHHFYAAPAPGKNFDAAPAPAPTLLYLKTKILKRTKVYTHVETFFSYDSVRFLLLKI